MDNAVARAALSRGNSRTADFNELVERLWLELAAKGVVITVCRVPSDRNPADAPTRPQEKAAVLDKLRAAGFEKESWEWPRQWLRWRRPEGARRVGNAR